MSSPQQKYHGCWKDFQQDTTFSKSSISGIYQLTSVLLERKENIEQLLEKTKTVLCFSSFFFFIKKLAIQTEKDDLQQITL